MNYLIRMSVESLPSYEDEDVEVMECEDVDRDVEMADGEAADSSGTKFADLIILISGASITGESFPKRSSRFQNENNNRRLKP